MSFCPRGAAKPENEVLVRHKDSVRSAALGTLGEVREFPCRCLCETLLLRLRVVASYLHRLNVEKGTG